MPRRPSGRGVEGQLHTDAVDSTRLEKGGRQEHLCDGVQVAPKGLITYGTCPTVREMPLVAPQRTASAGARIAVDPQTVAPEVAPFERNPVVRGGQQGSSLAFQHFVVPITRPWHFVKLRCVIARPDPLVCDSGRVLDGDRVKYERY